MDGEIFWVQLLGFLYPYLKAFALALPAALANEQVVEAIKVAVNSVAKSGDIKRWALVIAVLVPASVVAFLGLDFFRAIPGLQGADPVVTGGFTTLVVAFLSGLIHDKIRKPLDAR